MNKFILGIILILVGVGLLLTMARSKYAEYQTINTEIQDYENALDQANQLNQIQQSLNAKYESIPEEQRKRIEKLLPRNIDTVRLTIEIDNIAENNGVDISALSFAQNNPLPENSNTGTSDPATGVEINQTNNYSSVDMSFEADGTYGQLNDFIQDLESNLRLTDIRSLDISSSDDDLMKYQVVIRTYWLGT